MGYTMAKHPVLPCPRELLGNEHQAYTTTVAPAAVAPNAKAAVVEVHSGRVNDLALRSRPVVAVGTDTVDRSPTSAARSRQEDCTGLLQGVPL